MKKMNVPMLICCLETWNNFRKTLNTVLYCLYLMYN